MGASVSEFYVYTYTDPLTGDFIYIGKGKGDRLYRHLCPSHQTDTPFYRKLRKMICEGRSPIVEKLFDNLTEREAFTFEKFCILSLGRRTNKTGHLLNLTDGGEGVSGYRASDETRRKNSESSARRAIVSLDPETGEITHYESISAAGPDAGNVASCLAGRRDSAGGRLWFDGSTPIDEILEARDKVKIRAKPKSKGMPTRPVIRIDLDSGEETYFSSLTATGLRACYIYSACRGRQPTAYGYGWRYATDAAVQPMIKATHKETLAVKYFKNQADAVKATGARQQHISACCYGKQKSAGGYLFQFVTEDTAHGAENSRIEETIAAQIED
jgi:hypothetical protein